MLFRSPQRRSFGKPLRSGADRSGTSTRRFGSPGSCTERPGGGVSPCRSTMWGLLAADGRLPRCQTPLTCGPWPHVGYRSVCGSEGCCLRQPQGVGCLGSPISCACPGPHTRCPVRLLPGGLQDGSRSRADVLSSFAAVRVFLLGVLPISVWLPRAGCLLSFPGGDRQLKRRGVHWSGGTPTACEADVCASRCRSRSEEKVPARPGVMSSFPDQSDDGSPDR